ncbi:MAG: alkaline phosphatase family protein [Nitrospinae bacterium]|nr:alkaline phosphatase family protein [Nitrospinota bacterium]
MDDFKEKLRQSGYLKVEDYLSGDIRPGAPLFLLTLKASVKLGLLCGLPMGLLTGLLPAALNPRLAGPFSDALVLSCYMAAIFSFLSFFAVLLIALATNIVHVFCRKREINSSAFPRYIGWGTSLAFGLYYIFWVRSMFSGTFGDAGYSMKFFLLDLAFILLVLFLARLAAAAARIFISYILIKEDRKPRVGKDLLPLYGVLAGVMALSGTILALEGRLAGPDAGYSREKIAVMVREQGTTATIIGIDGVSRKMLLSLARQGSLSNISALMQGGALAVFPSPPDMESPAVWTTLGTGVTPSKHGIKDFGQTRIRGVRGGLAYGRGGIGFYRVLHEVLPRFSMAEEEPVSGDVLSVKPVWEILSDSGRKVGVVNWWATWPVSPINGAVISDRAFLGRFSGEGSGRDVYPETLLPSIKKFFSIPDEIKRNIFSAGRQEDGTPKDKNSQENLDYILSLDYFTLQSTLSLLTEKDFRLVAAYFPGVDLLKRAFFKGKGPLFDEFLDANERINRYMAYMDGFIGQLHRASQAQPGKNIFVLIFEPGKEGVGDAKNEEGEGMAVFSGEGIEAGRETGAVLADFVPTVLALFGFPMSREFEGRALKEILKNDLEDSYVPTYGRREFPLEARGKEEGKKNVMERFKSLGYIQ